MGKWEDTKGEYGKQGQFAAQPGLVKLLSFLVEAQSKGLMATHNCLNDSSHEINPTRA